MNYLYNAQFNSIELRGYDNPETPRPWDLTAKIISYCLNHRNKLLDIGCGNAKKLLPLSSHFKEIIAFDINKNMIESAIETIKNNKKYNIRLVQGDSNTLPFSSNTFDVVTCILSRWNIKEIARVLKPGGIVIIEHIGSEDKKEFKILFGKDSKGWRGQFIGYQRKSYLFHYFELFFDIFNIVSIENGYWQTYYTEEGLLQLLKFTPTIRNFDIIKDRKALDKAIARMNTPHGILLTQNRILIYAKNIWHS
ncbi:MAG: hypothetical protein A3F11_06315 [Gammaproteobacteria bacterium RIFCSPHIGHO2_12_FULL_37_14]|nr:MAG: hypothetical protein A3F11_06315 [Gammaproteobacteria bacterium RIFCSPHIGHO2_12_FULL_37_14]